MRLGHLLLGATAPAGGSPISGAYVIGASSSANAVAYTFSSLSFGTAAADRHIVVGGTARHVSASATTAPTVTIGGVSATVDVFRSYADSNTTNSFLARAAVPTGTTGDVVVTWATGQLRCSIGVWRITGAAALTVTDTGYDETTAGNSLSAGALSSASDGYCAAVVGVTASATTMSESWSGVTVDGTVHIESNFIHSSASAATTGAAITPALTWSNNLAESVLVAATYIGA